MNTTQASEQAVQGWAGSWVRRRQVRDASLHPIIDKLEAGERLGFEDGVALYRTPDLATLGILANRAREAKNGNRAYFNVNRHINHTNICVTGCSFCAFAKKPRQEGAHRMSIEEIAGKAVPAPGERWEEIHIVGGLDPGFSFQDCLEMLRAIRAVNPSVHLKTLTLVEVDYYAKRERKSPQEILAALREAGMGSMPGGGAEILGEELRRKICPNKISGQRWLDLARIAHQMGIRSNCTMLYGHVETVEDRVDHVLRLRELQDETGGFMAFIPLQFNKHNTPYENLPDVTGEDNLKTLAVSRLLFDNIDHIKVYWIMVGLKIAQTALWFGADDIDGTVVEERITHDAGATTPVGVGLEDLLHLIRKAGRVPVERDSLYGIRQVYA
ncbi:MAG: aminofutalosine synthase MqnE [Acidobacteriota bacterium]